MTLLVRADIHCVIQKVSSDAAIIKQCVAFCRSTVAHDRLSRALYANQEFKKGASALAIKAGVPIVPVLCSGAQRVMAKHSMVIHPQEILVEFLEPIDASKYGWEERDVLSQRVHDAMAAGLPPEQRPAGFPGAA